jgi:hypothetical protein
MPSSSIPTERSCRMITRDQAELVAAKICGAPQGDIENGWELKEFDRGWLLNRNAARDRRGGLTFVIERESGRVMSFPSFVPPAVIMRDYDEALQDGRQEDL